MLPPQVRPRDKCLETNWLSREDTLYDREEVVSHYGDGFLIAVLQCKEDTISQFGDIWLEPISIPFQRVGDCFYCSRVPTNVIYEKMSAEIVVEDFRVVILPSRRI